MKDGKDGKIEIDFYPKFRSYVKERKIEECKMRMIHSEINYAYRGRVEFQGQWRSGNRDDLRNITRICFSPQCQCTTKKVYPNKRLLSEQITSTSHIFHSRYLTSPSHRYFHSMLQYVHSSSTPLVTIVVSYTIVVYIHIKKKETPIRKFFPIFHNSESSQ